MMDPRCTCGAVEDGKWAFHHSPDCPAAWTLEHTIAKMKELVRRAVPGQGVQLSQYECGMLLDERAELLVAKDAAFENGYHDAIAELNERNRQREKDTRHDPRHLNSH